MHQLLLEESVEKGRNDPTRLMKLKKRQLNALPFDSKWKSYIEKCLETPPACSEVREISVNPLPLKLTSDNSSESVLEIYDVTTVSPVKETFQGKESTCSSPTAHEVVLKPSMEELYGEFIDRQIVKVPEPSADGERDEIPSIHHKVMDEKEITVDGEGKPEGSVDGDISDDMTSEVANYMDALTTMESETETDHDYRLKSDLGLSNIEKIGMDPDRNGEQLEFEVHSSDSQSIEHFSASDDGSISFKKGGSSFSYSDTLRNMAEITPSDCEGSAKVFPTKAFISENPETPSNQLPEDMAVLRTKSHYLTLQNGMCIDEDNIRSLGEASSNSSLADSNHTLPLLDPATSSMQHHSDETAASMKPGFTLSYSDERETNLADSSAVFSDMPAQIRDAVSAESHSVDKLDGGDPYASSDVSLHLSNNSELAPEKKSSDDSPNEVLQIDLAEKSYPDNTVDIKIGSPRSNISHKEEPIPYSVLSQVEGSYVEKHDDLVSEVVDALPETEVYRENSTSIGDASQNCSLKEQQSSVIMDNVPLVELESAVETALYSEEANVIDTSGSADREKIGASNCKVDAVDQQVASLELPSNFMECSILEDHAGLEDVVAESVQAENMAVSSTATDNVPAEASADDDIDVVFALDLICSPSDDKLNSDLICSPSDDKLNSGMEDPLKNGLECNELVSPECFTGPEAENETTQMEVATEDVDSASSKLISSDKYNSDMVDAVQNSLAEVTQNSLPTGDVTITHTTSGLRDLELESKYLHQIQLLEGGEDVMSSPAVHLRDPETSSEQPLELQSYQLNVECMKAASSYNSPHHLSEQIQSSNLTDQESNDASESCQEDIPSEPSPSGYLQQSSGQEINNTKQEMDSLSSVLPSFGTLPEVAQFNRAEVPPLPPLPPMQWRLGKLQHAPVVPQTEFMDCSPDSFPSILPFRDHEKAQSAFPAQQSDIGQPANSFLNVSAVEVEKSQHVSEQVDNVMQPTLSSLQLPFMANDANNQTNSHCLEGNQSWNPFSTLSALPDVKPEHGFLASEHELVQLSSNPFLYLPAVEDTASKYAHVSSSEKLIPSLNQSALEPAHQQTSEDLEGEHGNPSDTCVLPPRKVEDTASASEPGIQNALGNSEEEHGNPSDTSMLPHRKVEDTASTYDPVSSLEKSIHPLNQSASEPALQNTAGHSEEEHGHPSDTYVLSPRKVEEQLQPGLPISEGESAWPSNPFALLVTSGVGQVNGGSIVKIPRPRNPLIDAVAAHDKSKLRKVIERVQPQSELKDDERNSLLEQIRAKSFNLKPAVASRPSIEGPKTNLRVAAILEKANAIRQATAGSDEDDDEDWSDS